SDRGVASVGKLSYLHSLSLDCSRVSAGGLAPLGHLLHLKEAFLTHVAERALVHLAPLAQLESLDITESSLDATSLRPPGDFTALSTVRLRHARADTDGWASLQALVQLRVLYIEKGDLTDAALSTLSSLGELRQLDLRGNHIGDGALAYLARLSRLARLNLSD